MKSYITLGTLAGWLLVGVIWGAQTALGSTIGMGPPLALGAAIADALRQVLPWIPVTLAVIALTVRFPFAHGTWRVPLLVHALAAPALAFAANVLVVLGYWASNGRFNGFVTLAKQGAMWATLRFHIALVIYLAILGITQGVLYYRRTRERELQVARLEGQLVRARLDALTAQLRPHFLFNTMHTIGQLWRSGRSDEADAVLDHLGSLFHRVQQSTSRSEVPLSEELELVREYLAIEETRFRDRLRPAIDAAPDALECMVPPLILQPIVENAVRHGISAVSHAGTVEVTATLDGGRLVLRVRDDGPGIDTPSPMRGTGTGLRNTRERLAQRYGTDARLDLSAVPSGGTLVSIELPVGHA